MRQVWRGLLWIGMAGAAGLLAAGYLGRWSPVADALSIGRLPAAMAVLVLAALLVRPVRLVRGLGAAAALSVLVTLAGRLIASTFLLTLITTALLVLGVREAWRSTEQARFDEQFRAATSELEQELVTQTESLREAVRA